MTEDKILHCSECGINFMWTAEEQAGHGDAPAKCPMCLRLGLPPGQRRGIVKWFNRSKGFGFITDTEGAEVFVHKSGLGEGQPLLRTGQLVQFALATGPRGAQATGVKVLEMPEVAGPEA